MPFENNLDLIAEYALPFRDARLEATHRAFRTTISFSSFRSRYGQPILQDAVKPTKELFQKIDERIQQKDHSKLCSKHDLSMIIFLKKPQYSVNQRKFGFTNNNFGYFLQGITIAPTCLGDQLKMQELFDSVKLADENAVIVEKVHLQEIWGRMPTAFNYVTRVLNHEYVTSEDIIYTNNSDRND